MFFSIIIPVYQSEKTIRRCLNSVLKQQFNNYEVILIDDGSIDRSEEICKHYTSMDNRFHYIRKDNGGPSSARNMGLDLAQGEYVVFLDSDDCYRDTYLLSFYNMIKMYRGMGHFWCGYTTISNNPKEDGITAVLSASDSMVVSDRKEIMTLHNSMLLASLCNKAFKNSLIQKYHLRMNEKLSLGEDLLFNLSYLDYCPDTGIVVWNHPEYEYYCFSTDSLNHKYRSDLDDIFRLIRGEIYYHLKKWGLSREQFVEYETMVFYMLEHVIWNYYNDNCKMSHFERRKAIKKILNSKEFQKALNDGNITMHPLFKLAYRSGNWGIILSLHRLLELKKVIRGSVVKELFKYRS